MENKTTPAPEALTADALFADMMDMLRSNPQTAAGMEWQENTPEGQEAAAVQYRIDADGDCDVAPNPADLARIKELNVSRDEYIARRAPEIARELEAQEQ